VPGVDPVALEIPKRAIAQRVVAEIRDHDDFSAKLGRGDRLIGSLAAETRLEMPGKDCLAPNRHALDRGGKIHICRADDSDARTSSRHAAPPFGQGGNSPKVALLGKGKNWLEEIGEVARRLLERFRIASHGDAELGASLQLGGTAKDN
jgi:hypothetical protein